MNPPLKSYVLVSPVRDEAATIGRTIEAVTGQTILPREWVIVSDGSTDRTNEIVTSAAHEHPWIKLLALPPRPGRSFAAVVHNTHKGIEALSVEGYEFLGLLDGDVVFQPDYFEQLIQRFEVNPKLGLSGGVVIDVGLPKRLPKNRLDVPGAVQFYRRSCFESMAGLIPIPEGGWDGMACAVARMRGFQTMLCTDLMVDHLKPRNISEGGVIRRKWQMGVRDYAAGYHPLFELFKCAGRISEPPFLMAACAWFFGYCTAAALRRPRVLPQNIQDYVRKEQIQRLQRLLLLRPATQSTRIRKSPTESLKPDGSETLSPP